MLSNNNKKKCKKIREQGTTSNVLSIVWAPAYILYIPLQQQLQQEQPKNEKTFLIFQLIFL